MFSATFPRQMEALARKILQKPIEVQVGGRSVVCRDVDQNVVGGRLNFLWVMYMYMYMQFYIIVINIQFQPLMKSIHNI